MPRWSVTIMVLTTVAMSLFTRQLFDHNGEADKPLAVLQGDGFSVRMPGEPKREQTQIPIPIVGPAKDLIAPTAATSYTSASDDEAFVVSVVDGPMTAAADLDDGLTAIAQTVGGRLRDRTVTRHRGHRAVDARIVATTDGEPTTIFVRAVHAGDRVFLLQAIVAGEDIDTPPAQYAPLVASLHIRRTTTTTAGNVDRPALLRKRPPQPPGDAAVELRACRRHADRGGVPDAVRERALAACARAAHGDAQAAQDAALAVCVATARETADLEACGFDVVRP